MDKLTILSVFVLLLALAVPLCTARGHQGPRTDNFIDAPYTTMPPNEMPTAALAESIALECPGRYGTIRLIAAETDT